MTNRFVNPIPPGGPRVGALIVGGDFHGLAIVRSLARRGIPVCVVDNEHSIARFSRYTTHYVKVAGLRGEQREPWTLCWLSRNA